MESAPPFLFEVFEAAAVAGVGEIGDGEVFEGLDGRQFLESPGVARLQLPQRVHACGGQGGDPRQGHVSEIKARNESGEEKFNH